MFFKRLKRKRRKKSKKTPPARFRTGGTTAALPCPLVQNYIIIGSSRRFGARRSYGAALQAEVQQ